MRNLKYIYYKKKNFWNVVNSTLVAAHQYDVEVKFIFFLVYIIYFGFRRATYESDKIRDEGD